MKKNSFMEILSFEVFFDIFKYINDYIGADTISTDVKYFFGNEDGGSPQNIPYGNFKINAYPEQIEYLGKEILLLEPFGKATNPDDKAEYYVMILNAHDLHGGNYSILMQQKGHMGAPIANTLRRTKLNINQMTNVVILCPMNISTNQHDMVYQTQYHFENLIYTKDGELFCPYYKFDRKIEDNRD
ncbi:MAG: hypothetical protein V4665_03610 [Patescibacteria group bacterium]